MKTMFKYCSCTLKDKNGKEYIGGIADFQFVPSKYSFGSPCKAKAFIEFKAPNFSDNDVYIPLPYKITPQIEHEFKSCDKIIYTDGISWYFLEKDQIILQEPINLMDDDNNWNILRDKITVFIKESDV